VAAPEPALVVEPAEPVLVELRPLADGGVRVRLRNITAEDVTVAVRAPGRPAASVRVRAYDAADAVLPG
jgi:hypothetical protein